jgi:quercetin dioxygenase-like cupin family protein
MKHIHYTDVELEDVDEGCKDVSIRWLITKDDGAENFAMRLFDLGPGGHTPFHNHDFEHEVFIVEGQGTLRIEGREESLKRGDVVFVPADVEHQFLSSAEGTLRFLCLIPYKD